MPRLKRLSGNEVIRTLGQFGFAVHSQRGSHVLGIGNWTPARFRPFSDRPVGLFPKISSDPIFILHNGKGPAKTICRAFSTPVRKIYLAKTIFRTATFDPVFSLGRYNPLETNLPNESRPSHSTSGGLRLGEVVRLRPEDIDLDRNLIHIRQGKRRKDRLPCFPEWRRCRTA